LPSGRPALSEALARYSFFLFDQSVTAVTDLSFASFLIPTTATSIWRQGGGPWHGHGNRSHLPSGLFLRWR
jgi:hypothetical protein